MPEVWTRDNLSRHFMPRSDTVFQLFILLCSIVSFMFYSIDNAKLRIFLRSGNFSNETAVHYHFYQEFEDLTE